MRHFAYNFSNKKYYFIFTTLKIIQSIVLRPHYICYIILNILLKILYYNTTNKYQKLLHAYVYVIIVI